MRRQNTSFLNVGSLLVVDSGRWAILAQNWKSSEEILQRLSQGSSFRLYPYSTVVAMVGSRWPLREHRKSQNGSNRARHHVGLGPCGIQAKKKRPVGLREQNLLFLLKLILIFIRVTRTEQRGILNILNFVKFQFFDKTTPKKPN